MNKPDDNNESGTTDQAAPAKRQAPTSKPEKPKPKRRSRSGVFVALALIIALLALAGSAYNWWRMRAVIQNADQDRSLAKMVTREQRTIEQLKDRINNLAGQGATTDALDNAIADAKSQVNEAIANLDARQSDFASRTEKAIATLRREVGTRRAGTYLADAAYLLRVARAQGRVRHDPVAMRIALQSARDAVAQLQTPAAQALQKRIEAAIARINALPVDNAGAIATKLAHLASNVESLSLQVPGKGQVKASSTEQRQTRSSGWWASIGDGLANALGELVTIRHPQSDIHPLLAPEQRWFLYRNLSLALDAARVAAIEGRTQVYQASIDRGRRWLKRFFDTSDPDVAAALKTLDALHGARLEPALPDLSAAFEALDRVRRQTAPDAAP